MISNKSFFLRSSFALNNIKKLRSIRPTAKATCSVLFQAIADFHARKHWLSKNAPRFKTASWHRAYIGKLFLGILWPVSTPKCHHESNDFSPKFQSTVNECLVK